MALRKGVGHIEEPRVHFVEGPGGIVTAGGVRFRTTVAMLREFAGPVLDRVDLDVFLKRTEVWLDSGRTLALWLLPFLLLILPPAVAVAITVTVYLAWEGLSPAFPSRAGAALFLPLRHPAAQGLYYALTLTWLYLGGEVAASVLGLVMFVVFRLELAQRAAAPLVRWAHERFFPLPASDQVLRALIIREAIRLRLSLPILKETEAGVRGLWQPKVRMSERDRKQK